MKDLEFFNSLKALVVDEKRAEKVYRDMMQNRYNMTSENSSFSNASSESSGNIQEIAYEDKDDDMSL